MKVLITCEYSGRVRGTAPADKTPLPSSPAMYGVCGECPAYSGKKDGSGYCTRWDFVMLVKRHDESGCKLWKKA